MVSPFKTWHKWLKLLNLSRVSPWLLALPFLLLTVYATADVIREGDQASLLDGSLQLASGANPWSTEFYNYDKQYITFWVVALVFWLRRFLELPITEVYLGNLFSCLFLWSGVLALLAVARRSRFLVLGVLCVITAPSFLLQTPFLSTAAVSSAFLLWLTWSLLRDNRSLQILVPGILAFAAVGARADAVLAIPFLLWLTTPIPDLRSLLKRKETWIVIVASILSVTLGGLIYAGQGLATNNFFFYPKIFLAYFAFGLGGAGILYLFCIAAIARKTVSTKIYSEQMYMVVGCVLMLPPFLFYAAQLLSTRYWMLTVDVLFCFVCSYRGQEIVKSFRFPKQSLSLALTAVCLFPLVLGLHLPFPSSPRLTLTHPTLFPTADGVMPMGTYAYFLVPRLRNAHSQFVDHNQVVWQAAESTQFELGSNGTVPILETHLPMFLRLAATTQGKRSQLIPPSAIASYPFFYAESRSFTKQWVELNNPSGYKDKNKPVIQSLLFSPAEYQSERLMGIGVLKFGQGDRQWSQEFLSLNPLFQGNEYHLLPASKVLQGNSFIMTPEDYGKTLVFYSPQSFSLTLINQQQRQILQSTRESDSALATIKLRGNDWFGKQLSIDESTSSLEDLKIAKSVFTDWMSVGTVSRNK
ncbi:hypothetical protein [Calothrix sp. NIES-2098]|uniref:hypothetical protein n=1 Tax=Calothrix sp. NIES-2098 TaxID=1954171 RepID=UPI000B5F6B26|nr:hypothetical protein NIES2098_71480 [Calothrix sp. NIES-2098]